MHLHRLLWLFLFVFYSSNSASSEPTQPLNVLAKLLVSLPEDATQRDDSFPRNSLFTLCSNGLEWGVKMNKRNMGYFAPHEEENFRKLECQQTNASNRMIYILSETAKSFVQGELDGSKDWRVENNFLCYHISNGSFETFCSSLPILNNWSWTDYLHTSMAFVGYVVSTVLVLFCTVGNCLYH